MVVRVQEAGGGSQHRGQKRALAHARLVERLHAKITNSSQSLVCVYLNRLFALCSITLQFARRFRDLLEISTIGSTIARFA
jgi:hypothetical protein